MLVLIRECAILHIFSTTVFIGGLEFLRFLNPLSSDFALNIFAFCIHHEIFPWLLAHFSSFPKFILLNQTSSHIIFPKENAFSKSFVSFGFSISTVTVTMCQILRWEKRHYSTKFIPFCNSFWFICWYVFKRN